MVPAMARGADRQQRGRQFDYLRQVVFLTDGDIGNEQQLFETITAMRGRSRVFMVGIGSAPNTYLMSRAAELGRGTFTISVLSMTSKTICANCFPNSRIRQ